MTCTIAAFTDAMDTMHMLTVAGPYIAKPADGAYALHDIDDMATMYSVHVNCDPMGMDDAMLTDACTMLEVEFAKRGLTIVNTYDNDGACVEVVRAALWDRAVTE